MKTTEKASFSIFINPKIEKQLENGPLIRATGQAIVYRTTEDKWEADVDLLEIDEIVLMGVSIKGYNEQKATVEHFKSMGINLYSVLDEELNKISTIENIEQFVFEQTGIKLPQLLCV